MLKNVKEVREAAAKVVEGRLTVWNARLELAMSSGNAARVDAILDQAEGGGSGCGCGCGCGCDGGGSGCGSINPTTRPSVV
jgi:hypothetical protein